MGLPLVLVLAGLGGCSALSESYSDEIDRTYNPWLGRTKEARIQAVGPANRCAGLRSHEEVCAWDRIGLDMPAVRRLITQTVPSWTHHVVYVYDQTGIALSWHYSGTWGERSSRDRETSGPPRSEALLP